MRSDDVAVLVAAIKDLRAEVAALSVHHKIHQSLGGLMGHPDADPVVMDSDAIRAYTGRHRKTVDRAAKAGALAYIQSGEGGRIGYRLSALNTWLDSMSSGPARPVREDADRPWDL